jgi:hypothetical protein
VVEPVEFGANCLLLDGSMSSTKPSRSEKSKSVAAGCNRVQVNGTDNLAKVAGRVDHAPGSVFWSMVPRIQWLEHN